MSGQEQDQQQPEDRYVGFRAMVNGFIVSTAFWILAYHAWRLFA